MRARCRFCFGSPHEHDVGCPAIAKPELLQGPTPIYRAPFTKREIEMLIGCFRGFIIGTDHEGAPWSERLLAKARAMYTDAKARSGDDSPDMPPFGDVMKIPIDEKKPNKRSRAKKESKK
jgi:hypothetical protein